ncbi:MAG: EscU/YscU/HrcU family type III secretion system export apparatus switch protein [Gammaproteobacteria bacterium]
MKGGATPIAVTLHYDGDNAPQVSAKGAGSLAEQILSLAREHDIPLHEDEQLVEVLAQLELGDEIPETLYQVVAEIIAFVYVLQGRFPKACQFTPEENA